MQEIELQIARSAVIDSGKSNLRIMSFSIKFCHCLLIHLVYWLNFKPFC